VRWTKLVFRFVSEKAAEDFIQFLAEEYELEADLNAYLHVEVLSEEFEDEEALTKLHEEAERFGAGVLL